ADPEFAQVDDLVIGSWGDAYETSAEKILEDIIANKEKFSHVTKLFVGDMDYEECEVSWIIQGNYEALFAAMPQLESLTIKGSTDLQLGQVVHPNLKSLTIICGGLPRDVIASIRDAKLPALENLVLYLGVEDYGFDGSVKDIAALLEQSDFPKLRSLGICDSEIQDEVTKLVLESKYIDQLHVLDLSQGTLTDKGGKLLLAQLPAHSGIQELDLQYHFLSDEMMEKLAALPIDVNVEEQNEPDEYDGDLYYYPCLTE
ncbi:MAG: STM4015 family protein, partial [Eubacteriales bacterium]|nr:STM4015 family protein [Eubacteriales bacterium]